MIGARNAISWAWSLHHRTAEWMGTPSGTAGRRGNLGSIAQALEAGQILAAAERNPPHVRAWLAFAYGLYTQDQFHELTARLWADYLTAREPPMDRRPRLRALSIYVLDDYRHVLSGGKPRYSHDMLAASLGVPVGSWMKCWEPERRAMSDIIDRWDVRGLQPVARVLRKQREAAGTQDAARVQARRYVSPCRDLAG